MVTENPDFAIAERFHQGQHKRQEETATPLLKNVERKIANCEGFEVTIRHADGPDMRGDKEGLPSYHYQNAARNDITVAQWREMRFKKVYPAYDVTVWLADGSEAHGVTKLSTVRDTYLEE